MGRTDGGDIVTGRSARFAGALTAGAILATPAIVSACSTGRPSANVSATICGTSQHAPASVPEPLNTWRGAFCEGLPPGDGGSYRAAFDGMAARQAVDHGASLPAGSVGWQLLKAAGDAS